MEGKGKRTDIGRIRMKCKPGKVYRMVEKTKEASGTWGSREAMINRFGFGGVVKISKWSGISTEFVKWVVENFEREKVPHIRLSKTKVLKLTEEDVHRVYKLPRDHRRVHLTRCRDEDIRNLRDDLGISGIKNSIHISELEDKLDSLDDATAWAKAAVLYIAYCLLNPINSNNVSLRYASILGDVNSISQYDWCGHVLDNLRECIRENNKLNPLGDMHFILINYLERMGKGCRLLLGNYKSPSLREWDKLKVAKAMEQVDEIVGFSKAVAVGITKERKGDDGLVFLPFDPVACPMDKVPKHVAHCKCQIDAYQECMEVLTKWMDEFNKECESVRNKDASERAKKKKKVTTSDVGHQKKANEGCSNITQTYGRRSKRPTVELGMDKIDSLQERDPPMS
ncbi:hypothetical protein LIER_34296 [Lithospermum erythrorhizon]|uniref:Uncharacterized protein n=1 Tax=Lithospermum erythrorhizon TaxID=34254 RepID=A0AAV3RZ96_LITER